MHYSGVVIVEKDKDVQEQVEEQLADYENERWDWWTIGGRWTGILDGYKPEEDTRNITTCSLCHGTGKRDDELGKEARRKDPAYTCNGCDGKGEHVKWPTEWAEYTGNIQPIERVSYVPFFVVTDGEWLEKETWDGNKLVGKSEKEWKGIAQEIYKKNAGKLAVIVDVHN